mmetsp:Transcript_16601/g.27512  ORF Transcript_16601/g.27512 Transcript_16601/m.27512 type:complete len:276 (-) Transcript_16601:154-981(-)
MSTSVSGSHCLVLGSSDPGSVGYHSAKALLDAGAAQVIVVGRDAEKVDKAVTSLGSKAIGMTGNLREPETMTSLVTEAVEKMGGKLDILVISGGNGGSEYLGLSSDELESYRIMQDVAVHSPMMLTKAAFPYLSKADHGGSVVMVSSMAPLVPWPDTAPYNIARAAQNTLVETLAFQYRTSNVRVNAVLPSCIHTNFLDIMAEKKNIPVTDYAKLRGDAHPMKRNGTPQEVANAVLWLASPASSFTTGELLKIDGGLHLSNWFNVPKILSEYKGK